MYVRVYAMMCNVSLHDRARNESRLTFGYALRKEMVHPCSTSETPQGELTYNVQRKKQRKEKRKVICNIGTPCMLGYGCIGT